MRNIPRHRAEGDQRLLRRTDRLTSRSACGADVRLVLNALLQFLRAAEHAMNQSHAGPAVDERQPADDPPLLQNVTVLICS